MVKDPYPLISPNKPSSLSSFGCGVLAQPQKSKKKTHKWEKNQKSIRVARIKKRHSWGCSLVGESLPNMCIALSLSLCWEIILPKLLCCGSINQRSKQSASAPTPSFFKCYPFPEVYCISYQLTSAFSWGLMVLNIFTCAEKETIFLIISLLNHIINYIISSYNTYMSLLYLYMHIHSHTYICILIYASISIYISISFLGRYIWLLSYWPLERNLSLVNYLNTFVKKNSTDHKGMELFKDSPSFSDLAWSSMIQCDPAIPFLAICPIEMLCNGIPVTALFLMVSSWNQPKGLTKDE